MKYLKRLTIFFFCTFAPFLVSQEVDEFAFLEDNTSSSNSLEQTLPHLTPPKTSTEKAEKVREEKAEILGTDINEVEEMEKSGEDINVVKVAENNG